MRIRKKIGLYYNRFRYYDPSLGQYTQQDPIGLAVLASGEIDHPESDRISPN